MTAAALTACMRSWGHAEDVPHSPGSDVVPDGG